MLRGSLLRLSLLPALGLLALGCGEGARSAATGASSGWDYYRLGEYNLAAKSFEQQLAAATDPVARAGALYASATVAALRRPDHDRPRAEQLYREVIQVAPASDWAAWSWLGLARLIVLNANADEPDAAALRQAYQAVIDQFPAHLAAEEALLEQQATYVATAQPADARLAVAALERFVADHPRSPWRGAAWALLAQAARVLEDGDARLRYLLAASREAEIDPLNPTRDLSWDYWQIATAAEFEAGDFAVAREYYRKLIAEYPTEQKVFLAKQELQRMEALEAELRGANSSTNTRTSASTTAAREVQP